MAALRVLRVLLGVIVARSKSSKSSSWIHCGTTVLLRVLLRVPHCGSTKSSKSSSWSHCSAVQEFFMNSLQHYSSSESSSWSHCSSTKSSKSSSWSHCSAVQEFFMDSLRHYSSSWSSSWIHCSTKSSSHMEAVLCLRYQKRVILYCTAVTKTMSVRTYTTWKQCMSHCFLPSLCNPIGW